jgi:hypothetical protein
MRPSCIAAISSRYATKLVKLVSGETKKATASLMLESR